MRLNHRLRLATVSATASGIVLALLFLGVAWVVRQDAYNDLTAELDESMRNFTLDPSRPFDDRGFRKAYPSFSVRHVPGRPTEIVLDRPWREDHRIRLARPFRGQTLIVSADWRPSERSLRRLAIALGVLWPLLTLLVGVTTWLAARAVFRPLERLTHQAALFAGSSLAQRLETEDPHEFGEFAASLNGMLDRIEQEVRRGDRFAADAAHELRTPLAILRTRIDTSLLNPRSPEEYRETLRRARAEIVRLTDVAQALLRTARGEPAEAKPLALAPIVEEIVGGWADRFRERGVGLELLADDVSAAITEEEVRIVLDNLLDNALRFAPEGSVVSVRLARRDEIELSVADHGPGFPPELGDRAFDRLVRGDDSRNRGSGGAGIGLSVVRRVAESRGGRAFHQTTTGGGATVSVCLPPQ